MGFIGFTVWFTVGLVVTFALNVIFDSNPFISAFFVGLIVGVLGAKE